MSKLKDAFERGEGFYTVADVALYARMHPRTVRSWFFNRSPLFRKGTSTVDSDTALLTFTDLVEAIYVRRLREDYKISLAVIRTAIDMAARFKGVPHPFAHPEFRTVVVGREINIIDKKDPSVMTALAPNSGQKSDTTILNDFIDDLEFGAGEKIIKHIAFKTPSERVIIAPDFNFGAPLMESCGYPAEVLWMAHRVEGGKYKAAEIYGVTPETVQAAVDYYGGIVKKAA